MPVRIPLAPDRSVGTAAHPYETRAPAAARRLAIVAGAAERVATEGMTVRAALVQVKRRLHAIRILSRRTAHCDVYERDMRWMARHLGVGDVPTPSCAAPRT